VNPKPSLTQYLENIVFGATDGIKEGTVLLLEIVLTVLIFLVCIAIGFRSSAIHLIVKFFTIISSVSLSNG
jgi:hypothetical protein